MSFFSRFARFFKYERGAAAAVLAVVIVLSVFLGAVRSLNALKDRTEYLYANGSSGEGVPADDVRKMAGYAVSLCAIAEACGCARSDELRAAVDELNDKASDPFEVAGPYGRLRSASAMVYQAVMASDAAEAQKNSAILYYTEITSTAQRLAKCGEYDRLARNYNSAIRAPLAGIVPGRRTEAVVFN